MEEGGRRSPAGEDLEVIRTQAGMPITRFTALIGMPRRTYTRHRSRWLEGEPVKGSWPAPVVEVIEPTVAKLAEAWPAWGHRKIHAMHRLDHPELAASPASVERAMRRRGLLQPVEYQAERRQWAQARREAFVDPPTHRNQVWQLDFERHEAPLHRAEWKDSAAGPSQRAGEAEGSPTVGTDGRVDSSPDNDGTAQHCQMGRVRQARWEGVREEPASNAS